MRLRPSSSARRRRRSRRDRADRDDDRHLDRLLARDGVGDLVLDPERRAVALDPHALGRHAVVGQHRQAPELVEVDQRVIDRVQQDRVRRDRAGRVVLVERRLDRPEVLRRELAHGPEGSDPPARDSSGRSLSQITRRRAPRPARGRGAGAGAWAGRSMPGTSSATSAPTASTAAPTGSAAVMPSTYCCGESVAAGAREHGRQHRDAEHAAELADRVRRARGLADLLGRTEPSTALADGAKTSAMPAPPATNAGSSVVYATPTSEHRGEPGDRERLQREPGRHQRPRADPVAEDARRSARRRSASPSTAACGCPTPAARAPPRSGRTARGRRSSRRRRRTSRTTRRSSPRTCGCGRSAAAASAAARGPPRAGTAPSSTRPPRDRAEHDRAGPAERVGAHDPERQPEQAGAGEHAARAGRARCWGRGSRRARAARAGSARARSAR